MTDMNWLRALAPLAFACLVGCSTQPSVNRSFGELPTKYASTAGVSGEQLVLQCGSVATAAVSCQLWQEEGRFPTATKTAVEFIPLTTQQQYLKNLVANSAKEAVESPQTQREFPVADKDVTSLKLLERDQATCLADKKYADLMLLCPTPPQSSDTVVMFIRGLCDRCRFQPAVLRKIN